MTYLWDRRLKAMMREIKANASIWLGRLPQGLGVVDRIPAHLETPYSHAPLD